MKTIRLIAVFASILAFSACSDVSTANLTPEEIKAQAITDLSKMDIPEMIDFIDEQATDMTKLLDPLQMVLPLKPPLKISASSYRN